MNLFCDTVLCVLCVCRAHRPHTDVSTDLNYACDISQNQMGTCRMLVKKRNRLTDILVIDDPHSKGLARLAWREGTPRRDHLGVHLTSDMRAPGPGMVETRSIAALTGSRPEHRGW